MRVKAEQPHRSKESTRPSSSGVASVRGGGCPCPLQSSSSPCSIGSKRSKALSTPSIPSMQFWSMASGCRLALNSATSMDMCSPSGCCSTRLCGRRTATSDYEQDLSARSSETHDDVSEASRQPYELACRHPMYPQGRVVSFASLCGSNLGVSPTVPFEASTAFGEGTLLSRRLPPPPLRVQVRRVDGLRRQAFLSLVDVSAFFESDVDVLAQILPHDVLVVSDCRKVGIVRAPQNACVQEVVERAAPVLFLSLLGTNEGVSVLTSETRWDRVVTLRVSRSGVCRGGVLDHTVVEYIRSMQARVDRVQDIILGIQADLRNLLSELSRKRPAESSESSNSRCVQQRMDPQQLASEVAVPEDDEDLDLLLLEAYFQATVDEEECEKKERGQPAGLLGEKRWTTN